MCRRGKSYNHVVFYVIICFLLSADLVAQYTNLKFENYSTMEGLSSSTCVEIFQDSNGFLWFGTIDGLNMFDGYTFKVYRPIINDPHSISSNRINSIAEDHLGNLWVGTSNALNVFIKSTDKFLRIDLGRKSSLELQKNDVINDLFFDILTHSLWIATKDGLSKLELEHIESFTNKNLKFEHYIHEPNNPYSIDNNNVTSIRKDNHNNIWIGTAGQHLHKYNATRNDFDRIHIDISESFELDHIPKQFLIDDDGDFWIGNDLSRMVLWDRKKNSFKLRPLAGMNIPLFHIYQDKKDVIWFATDGYGIYFLDKKKEQLEHLIHNPDDPFSLPNNQPSKILEDNTGIFWIATYNKGVCKLDLSKSYFHHYFYQPGDKNSLSSKIAQSVMQDSKKRIWIGTDGGGLNLFRENEKAFKHFRADPKDQNSISSDKILYLLESYDGNIWVCTWDGGLNKFMPHSEKAIQYKYDPTDSYSIGQNTVWCAAEDSLHRLWLGTQSVGLILMDPTTQNFYQYQNKAGDSTSLISNFVFSIFIDLHNRLFVGTALGLCMVELDKLDDFVPKRLEFKQVKAGGFHGNRVNYITEDNEGHIWVGTDIGLYKINYDLHVLNTYTTQDGLLNNIVLGIEEDNNGHLWITTKSGLSLLDPWAHTFKNFNVRDGLQGIEFQSKSIHKTHDGRIIIGGINGFNIFNPKDINMNVEHVEPLITEFKLFNKTIQEGDTIHNRVLLDRSITNTHKLELKYNESHISFEIVALYYRNPERIHYAYRMNGLDKDFIYSRSNRIANYSNLPTGDYTFEVKASIDGVWENATSTKININVLPPPWKTWWAYISYIVLLLGIIWVSMRYYTKIVREEKEHELDQMKLRFFINVSHEFRTPLTLILNPIDKILHTYNHDEIRVSAQTIKRSASRLLNLVNQLLDLRKMDLGKAPLELVHVDIIEFSKDIFMLFDDLARVKNIRFHFQSHIETLPMVFDPDKVEKILTNLLSNAIKYTNSGGNVSLSVSKVTVTKNDKWIKLFKKQQISDYVEIKVEDTGVGFKKDQLQDVFSRFFHVDNTKTGTGIGLNFVKGLVELHGGEIFVESDYGKGSKFIVRLRIDGIKTSPAKKLLENKELVNYEYDIFSVKSTEYELAISDNPDEIPDAENPEEALQDEMNEKNETVLIVEDNKELRIHLKNELKGQFKVKEAVNGAEGLEKVQKFYPDIILSDIMMPEMDGFELCKKIKSDIDTCHIPIILLTARSLVKDKIEGFNTGADEYLPKPFNISVLKARIHNLLVARNRLREKFTSMGGLLSSGELTNNSLDEMYLDKSTKIILDNISDPDLSLDQILKELGTSRSQFYRKITSLTGQNPSKFIRTIRLKYASELLMKEQNSIKEVAYQAGFNSTAYFSKTFKEQFGITPKEFINKEKDS